ncbi:probable E3 ubiquitin-protein ligase makorin-1 [Hetaerina americana]|uniref:probable E3 ubiquitin-protein ligase makorin-1 n=1 Tax=Hetaerina americana TaxID=62018 RepID=UPI003A7F3D5B
MAEGGGLPSRERIQDVRTNRNTPPICRYYARGACIFARKCRFLHVEAPARAEQTRSMDFNRPRQGENAAHKKVMVKSAPPPVAPVEENASGGKSRPSEDWVNASEFYPMDFATTKVSKTYAQAVRDLSADPVETEKTVPLCPYSKQDENCKYEEYCPFTHRLLCDICNLFCLDPTDENEQKKHKSECMKNHERDMEISFAIQRSKDKTCGVCFEVILEKAPRKRKFGILPSCNHCFCLACIRRWRQAKNFDSSIRRACPECRASSDFVCPSPYWFDNKEDKEKLISDYKGVLSSKDCKYFRRGRGTCPFGNKCFYLHAYPDGTKADVGPPVRHRRQNAEGDVEVQEVFLRDFFEIGEGHWQFQIDEFDDIFTFFPDSEDSDWSEYDFFL